MFLPGMKSSILSVARPAEYVGSVVGEPNEFTNIDTPGEALDVLSIAGTNDFVLFNATWGKDASNTTSIAGLSLTELFNSDDVAGPTFVTALIFAGKVDGGDTNPYLTVGPDLSGLSVIATVFRNLRGTVSLQHASGTVSEFDPPSLSVGFTPAVWITTIHVEYDDISDWVPPSGYTLAGFGYGSADGERASSAVAYKFADNTTENPGAWTSATAGVSRDWWATTIGIE